MAEEVVESAVGSFYAVEVTKNSKGYGWSVKASNSDIEIVKNKITELTDFCKEKYGAAE